MQNSSPPSRATVSWSRTASLSESATSRSRSSPAWWPKRSFTPLKPSRSIATTAKRRPARACLATSYSIRSPSPRRLAAPVSGSVSAQRRIAARSPSSLARVARSTATAPPTTTTTSRGDGSGPKPGSSAAGMHAASATAIAASAPLARVSAGPATSRASGTDSQKASPPPAAVTASAATSPTIAIRARRGTIHPQVSGRDRTVDWSFEGNWPWEPLWAGADGERLHYVDEGARNGRPVVMLHGNPAWAYLYRRFIAALVDAGRRAIAIDLLGFGRSDKPADHESYTIVAHARRVAALLDGLDLRDACLVVHDWGGPIGLPWAVANPDRVSRLMILNTFAPSLPGPMGKGLTLRMLRTRGLGQMIAVRRAGLTEDFLLGSGVRHRDRLSEVDREAYRAPHPDPASRAGVIAFPRQVPLDPDGPVAALT